MKTTKIVCTIGPASQDKETLKEMISAGMNIARINFSHGDYNFHLKTIQNIREVSKELCQYIGIICDLQGPKIRIGKLEKEKIELIKGKTIIITQDDVIGNSNIISTNYKTLSTEIKIGEKIFLDDGNIELKVISIKENKIICRIINSGIISPKKGINLPDTNLKTLALTDKDKKDLDFALENQTDFVALSFVRRAEDIIALKDIIRKKNKNTFIIAKIEKPEAINNLDKIINISDGLMVARGDLGAETSSQEVPILQKKIIKKCNFYGKPVITATQMLESMINNPRPTRAEASDVANAILDGTDAVMLSGETSVGEYPIKSVKIMADIAKRIEKEIFKNDLFNIKINCKINQKSISDTISYSTCKLLEVLKAKYIIAFTLTGKTAKLISKYRPNSPIIAMCPDENVLRQLSIYWGINGIFIPIIDSTEKLFDITEKTLIEKKLVKKNDTVILIGGVPVLKGYETNMIKIHNIKIGDKNI